MDKSGFADLVKGCQGELRRFLTALCCGNRELADDLAQDACVKAYLACHTLRDESKFLAWLLRIAYFSFISSKRAQVAATDIADAHNLTSDERSDDSFRYQALHLALARLGAKERSAILLHYMQGYNVKEIAELTGQSSDAVKQQLSRGRSHLKTMLENER